MSKVQKIRQDLQYKITKYALCSRALVIIIQYISNIVVPDHNANVFISPSREEFNLIDKIIHHLLGGFLRWDSQYFFHIAKYGYTYENTLAFFPLFPYLVKAICYAIRFFADLASFSSLFLVVSVSLNVYIFVKAAWVLFEISLFAQNANLIYFTMIIFVFNPASVFFTAPYSECLFCYLTFKSILSCLQYVRKYIRSPFTFVNYSCARCIFYISLSIFTRSNGILNVGFFVYSFVLLVMENFNNVKKSYFVKYFFMIVSIFMLFFFVSAMIIPFALTQIYAYINYCRNFENNVPAFVRDYGNENGFVLPGTFSKHNQSWCYDKVPLVYSYVQKHYWNVGFLEYFEYKQVPNFLLALPVLYIVVRNSLTFFARHKSYLFHLGIFQAQYYSYKNDYPGANFKKTELDFKINLKFVCVVHAFILSAFCFFNVHVQVTTRMVFSASPAIYWFCAEYFADERTTVKMKIYCLLYFVVGTVMFCNFLPWT